jgi:exopolyphosphatase / guanosine-5'-triphosphate,3'-diphosphate pyrophosphatase
VICACVDIGTNTTRVLVADVKDGRLAEVLQRRAFTRLGINAEIPRAKIDAIARVVAEQVHLADQAGAHSVRVVATAAIRAAVNRDEFVDGMSVAVEILDEAEEARLAFLGATETLGSDLPGTVAVVDVGGGSTEIAVGTLETGVTWARSFPIGSSSLAASVSADPPTAEDIARMRARAREAFEQHEIPPTAHAIAVGGSAASLPAVVGRLVHADAVDRALRVLLAAPAAEVARRHGLAPERTHLLPAGILVLEAAGARLGRPLRVGTGGLREGVVLELGGFVHETGQG